MAKNKLRVKYNNSALAILCSKCSVIIKIGKDFTEDELNFVNKVGSLAKYWMPPQYCDKCKIDKNE